MRETHEYGTGTEKLVEKYKESPTLVGGGIAVVAIAGASAFLFTEVEAILQARCAPTLLDTRPMHLS